MCIAHLLSNSGPEAKPKEETYAHGIAALIMEYRGDLNVRSEELYKVHPEGVLPIDDFGLSEDVKRETFEIVLRSFLVGHRQKTVQMESQLVG